VVDPEVDTIHGPRPVQKTGNISVPRELLSELGLTPGASRVHFALNPHIPGTLLLIPSRQMNRAMEAILQALAEKG
jgi:hypothetical protein